MSTRTLLIAGVLLAALSAAYATTANMAMYNQPQCTKDGASCTSNSQCCDWVTDPKDGSVNNQECCVASTANAKSGTCGMIKSCDGKSSFCLGGNTGDPLFTGFDGGVVDFSGVPDSFYNILSEAEHELNAEFSQAVMFDHNGTYITKFGLTFDAAKVSIAVTLSGALKIEVNGVPLNMLDVEHAMTAGLSTSAGNLSLVWDRYTPYYGDMIVLHTPLITFSTWSVAPGTVDNGGVVQRSYLDSSVRLLRAPTNGKMAGILGESYMRLLSHLRDNAPLATGTVVVRPEDRSDLKAASLFDTSSKSSLFGKDSARGIVRVLAEEDTALPYPLSSSVYGAPNKH